MKLQLNIVIKKILAIALILGAACGQIPIYAADAPVAKPTNQVPEIVLVEPADASAEKISAWKKEGFKGVAMVLDERSSPSVCQRAAKAVSGKSFDLYYWIEVGRNPAMAE